MKIILQGKKSLVFIIFLLVAQCICARDIFYGKISSIPLNIQALMIGHSWHPGCPVGFDQLAYLQLSYWGFDNRTHTGELIVYRPIAKETLAIFKELYAIKFPIERMQLPERLPKGVSNAEADNTSAFYCRQDAQTPSQLSKHSYGFAVDINDLYNPAIEGNKVSPEQGKKYLNRSLKHKGMIREGDKVFMIFTNHGWSWGGFYPEVDYQHFQKVITRHYRVDHLRYNPPDERIKTLSD